MTTDGRNRSSQRKEDTYASAARPDTDLYYSTTTDGDLHEQAMTVVRRRKNSVTKNTSPRQMLLTQAGRSNETDSYRNAPITSSYDRSSSNLTRSRGRKVFEKTSYKESFPLRCTQTDNTNERARLDIEHREVELRRLESPVRERLNQMIFVDDPQESLGSLSMSQLTEQQQRSCLRVKSNGRSSVRSGSRREEHSQGRSGRETLTASRRFADDRSPLHVQ